MVWRSKQQANEPRTRVKRMSMEELRNPPSVYYSLVVRLSLTFCFSTLFFFHGNAQNNIPTDPLEGMYVHTE